MISVISYSSSAKELKMLEESSRDALAMSGDEECEFYSFVSLDKLKTFIEENSLLDILYYDVTTDNSIPLLEKIRRCHKNTVILIIADMSVSPLSYMKPGIMASSLLLRPVDIKNIRAAVGELLSSIGGEDSDGEVFTLRAKEGNIRVPYSSILYFEAREKRVFLNTASREYAFYDTLENLTAMLPAEFMRCHKGFIVNTKAIRRVALSKNEIELSHQRIIPLSRSYKADIKALYQKRSDENGA